MAAPATLSNGQLLVIVVAQFAGTSLWFAGNAVLPDLQPLLHSPGLNGWITSAVQLGFIAGTLTFALRSIADRFPTTRVFFSSVLIAALFNSLPLLLPLHAGVVLLSRFGTGFFLAGVYPVGMKIAADWFRPVLGRAMGFLVGALVLGTAFPHLIRGLGTALPYQQVLLSVSLLAVAGGVLLLVFIPSKPVSGAATRFSMQAFGVLMKPGGLRSAVFGYFGHMWELYALWAFLPVLLTLYTTANPEVAINRPVWAFTGIAAGFVGCAAGGLLALRIGSQRVAVGNLIVSGCCLLLVPVTLSMPPAVLLLFLVVYGMSLAGDSPQLTTLVSVYVPNDIRGSVLTLVTCLGFSITIVSIQGLAWLLDQTHQSVWAFYLLLPGPVLGVWGLVAAPKQH